MLTVGGGVAAAATGELDFGDAPDSYGTILVSAGARHEAVGATLGATRDAEADGLPSVGADGDDTGNTDDEDGVTLPASFAIGELASVTVNVQNAPSGAKLDAWIDFDADGVFEESERLAKGVTLAEGNTALMFSVPDTAVLGQTYARFRLSDEGRLGPTEAASSGEVEDYQVTIAGADLGDVDFYEASALDLSGGDRTFFFNTAQSGLLTVDATSDSAGGDVTLRLVDSEDQTIQEVTGTGGLARIDHTDATGGNGYKLEVSGSNSSVDLRICNLVSQTGENVVVGDSDGDDAFTFSVSDTYNVTANGVGYQFADASGFTFNSTAGNDTIELVDSNGDDTLASTPEQMVLSGTPVDGTPFTVTANGFRYAHAYAKAGGNDTAEMVGSDRSERTKVSADFVKVMGGGHFNRAKFFEAVTVDMLAGNNAAVVAGSTDTDVFWAKKNEIRVDYDADIEAGEKPPFASLAYDVTVVGCEEVIARARGADDWIELHDSASKDVMIAKPHKVEMMNGPRAADNVERGDEYQISARGFRNVSAIADQGGDGDVAKLYDSAEEGVDIWSAGRVNGETVSTMSSPTRLLYEVLAFEQVGGYGFNGGLGEDHGTNQRDHSTQADFVFEYGEWE